MRKGIIVVVFVLIAAILAVNFVFLDKDRDTTDFRDVPVPKEQPEQLSEPAIRHPISEIQIDVRTRDMPEKEQKEPLPPLVESDPVLERALSSMPASQRLDELIIFDSLIRRFVVTVDNMTSEKLPQKYRFVEDVPDSFMVQETDDQNRFLLDPENYDRYNAFVDLAEAVDLRALVRIYSRFYPLFQEAYEDLGYPDRYFNDRVIEVIDELLATPQVEDEVELVRPKVFYQFADPGLEELSPGQKILIRMGPANAERVKTVLTELRRLLVSE